ncbi:MAG: hypothetical protein II802_02195 [Clostridia bacterium]|nr:hypothetical protein [Clostridia bacterium]
MLFSPKKYERYLAVLRQAEAERISKSGYYEENRRRLKKIITAEVLLNDLYAKSTSLHEFLRNILLAVFLKGIKKDVFMKLSLSVCGTYYIDNKALLTFLCEALSEPIKNETFLKIKTEKNRLYIFTNGYTLTSAAKLLAKKLKATVITLPLSNAVGYKIPLTPTLEKSEKFISAKEYLNDKFSVINIFCKY